MIKSFCTYVTAVIIGSAPFILQAQEIGAPYPKDRDLLLEGVKLHDEEKFAEAIQKYQQVHPNDSFYSGALHELSTSYLANKQYKEAAESALKGINLKNDQRRAFILLYANALEELKEKDSAIATYNMGLKEFPFYNRFSYEKGVTYARGSEWQKAIASYNESAKNNIFHAATHYRNGFIAADSKQPAIALLALQTYLLLNNEGDNVLYTVGRMEKIAQNEYSTDVEMPAGLYGDELSELNEIILSKAALSKKYKSKVGLDIWVIKQMQVTLEKLPADFKSDNWLTNFYVNFYKEVWKQNHFEGLILYTFQNINNADINKKVKSNQAKINAFTAWANTYLSTVRNDREVMLDGKLVKTQLWYDGLSLDGIGDKSATGEKTGPWEYYTQGYLVAKGKYNNNKKVGKWSYYYFNGQVKSTETLDEESRSIGEFKSYYDNGTTREISHYKQNNLDGETILYYANGQLKSKMNYANGKINGTRLNYNKLGILQNEGELKNGIYDGKYRTYHSNGQVDFDCNTVNGNFEGASTYKYENGKLKAKGNYLEDNRNGIWQWYYENGKLQSEGNYIKGKQTGTWKYYYESGILKEEANFDNGKLKGIDKSFDKMGRLWDETIYKNGKADSYKIFDTLGNVMTQAKTSGGKIKVENYNQYRKKRSEGMLVNGEENGIWKFYYANGALEYEVNYTKGLTEGIRKNYYKNGKPSYNLNYVNNNREGFYRSYYLNGVVQVEGYYQNDERHGLWKFYLANGKLDAVEFYQEGTLVGSNFQYRPDGKLYSETLYAHDFFNNVVLYDTLGTPYHKTNLINGTGEYNIISYSGKSTFKATYLGGERNGKATSYFGNGKINAVDYYKMGKREGNYESFHENGKVNTTGNYKNDEKDSLWTYRDEKGQVYRLSSYTNGEFNGEDKTFDETGKPEIVKLYVDGVRHGEYNYYGTDGTIIYRAQYENGVLIAYTWPDKDGKMRPFTPVKNETAEIVTYYANGNKALAFTIENGYYQKQYLSYYADGKLYEELSFVDGNYDGVLKEYYPNGNLKSKKDYLYDDLNGWVITYYPNGKIESETPYLMDYKHGKATYYDINGKVSKTTNYRYGVIYE